MFDTGSESQKNVTGLGVGSPEQVMQTRFPHLVRNWATETKLWHMWSACT